MEFLQKLKFIMKANVNAISDKFSKSKNGNEKELLDGYIQAVKESLRQVNSELALIEAKESVHFNKLCENQSLYEKYSGYASDAGTSIEAKKFLDFCDKLDKEKSNLEKNYENAKENTAKSREATQMFVDEAQSIIEKLEDMKLKLSSLSQLDKINKTISLDKFDDFEKIVDEIQSKIYYNEALAELNSESRN